MSYRGVLTMLAASVFLAGCVQPRERKEPPAKSNDAVASADSKHAGWWCQEHGVPEHMCSLCSDEVAAKLKKEGDWCKLHDRAQSQCFKCDPSKYAKFEAMYEAKYGKKPTRPPEEEFQK